MIGQMPVDNYEWIFRSNISVGTPRQNFLVEVDLWIDSELSLIDSNANLSKVSHNIPAKATYNTSASTTYMAIEGNYTSWCGYGHLAKDIATLGGVSVNASLGVVDKLGYWLNLQPIDGTLGLSPREYPTNNISLLRQVLKELDRPVLSLWCNKTGHDAGNSLITLGTEDTDNCHSDWAFVPQVGDWYDTHLSFASAVIDGESKTLDLNATVSVNPSYSAFIFGPNSFKYLIVNASNAVFNTSIKFYEVNCNISQAPNITLTLGGYDVSCDSTSRNVIMTGADYIRYHTMYKTCFISIYGYDDKNAKTNYVELPQQFLNNHCLAYNVQNRELGFATAKGHSTDPRQYSY
ncbi:eukaryotic aspartyl protease domain-containing protein [Ditylenchus destructor]|uniref:Eukaryotic aspartyl protease domain-containing protein n=1 Tax=Ditylenchus destructor TaxID=166010 RepID=A0AAD4NJR5_9BILA|nr:eukaryotic aspartyl protease domain-containing protein [Ditylenchus destructor]